MMISKRGKTWCKWLVFRHETVHFSFYASTLYTEPRLLKNILENRHFFVKFKWSISQHNNSNNSKYSNSMEGGDIMFSSHPVKTDQAAAVDCAVFPLKYWKSPKTSIRQIIGLLRPISLFSIIQAPDPRLLKNKLCIIQHDKGIIKVSVTFKMHVPLFLNLLYSRAFLFIVVCQCVLDRNTESLPAFVAL